MKIIKIILVSAFLLLYTSNGAFAATPSITNGAFATAPSTTGKAAILMDGNSGRILYEANINAKLPMASTTKVMTALVALEYGSLGDVITIPPEASGVEGSSIWLSAGEKHTLEDLLYGLMLRSGNDAAVAIAYHIGGSVDGFAKLMNETAHRIGAHDSNFVNPHGLPHDAHYTTAYDLALITTYALKNPVFETIVSTKYKTIPWEGHEWDRAMKNKNKLLWQLEGANGVKTGFTKKAGRCLVASSIRNGMQLVAVVLNCGPMFEEASSLLDYGFKEYSPYVVISSQDIVEEIPVKGGSLNQVKLLASEGFTIALRNKEIEQITTTVEYPEILEAPIVKGTVHGKLLIHFNGQKIEEIPLIIESTIEKQSIWDLLKKMFHHWR